MKLTATHKAHRLTTAEFQLSNGSLSKMWFTQVKQGFNSIFKFI